MNLLKSIQARLGRETSSGVFVPEIDGLRFVAIASVFFFHLSSYLMDKRGMVPAGPLEEQLALVLKTGSFGVQLFFVISGFVLALPFASHYLEGQPRVPLRRYFLRRLTRIEPPYIINLVLIFALLVVVNHQPAGQLLPHLLASLGYAHNAIYGHSSAINVVTWSLEIEVQFYLLAPLLARVFAVGSKALRRSLIVSACVVLMAIRQVHPPSISCLVGHLEYFLTGFLIVDVFITDWKRRPTRHWAWDLVSAGGWVAIIGLRAGGNSWLPFLPLAVFIAYLGAFRGVVANVVFRNGWIVMIGGMCYTIYLYHSLFISLIGRFLPAGGTIGYSMLLPLSALLMVPLTLAGCAVLFVWFEKPFMKRHTGRRVMPVERTLGFPPATEENVAFNPVRLIPAEADTSESFSPQKKIKVLHLITLSVAGGAQDNTFCTAELHNRRRFEVHIACHPDGQWSERARTAGDFFHALPTLVTPISPLNDLRAFIDILRLLRREKFDLIHTHTAKAGILGRAAAALCRVPFVVHTYHAFPFHDFMPAWKRGLYVFLERCARPFTDFFITLSENDRQEGRRRKILNVESSQSVYTGIDFDKLDNAVDPGVMRAKLNIPPDRPVVMMAGRLEPQKAPHLLVEAFSKVVKSNPEALLLLAGDGELRPLVETTIKRLRLENHVLILGFRSDVPDLLRMSDIFAFSSLWEAMGRAMVEAMLLGKPVVVPGIYGIPEIVHHEETGLLYDVGNVDQLAGGICRLLRDPAERERLGAGARQLTRHLFDVRQMVTSIEQIYERLLPSAFPCAEIVPLPTTVECEMPNAELGMRNAG